MSRDRRGTRRKTCARGVTGRPRTPGLLPLRARSRDKPCSYNVLALTRYVKAGLARDDQPSTQRCSDQASCSLANFTMFSTVKPNLACSFSIGADAQKVFITIFAPVWPT